MSSLRHAILVGDERQLPAMVKSEIAASADFGRSLFGRLAKLGYKKHLLNVQYMGCIHPSCRAVGSPALVISHIRLTLTVALATHHLLLHFHSNRVTHHHHHAKQSLMGMFSFINFHQPILTIHLILPQIPIDFL
ncbi:putative P-loop containing nucleoside triphosphate hydrolase [Rosa chinensis]|uniref:Putative P-loop containing nucleoside triphosphate hydrolase n=1 Tax=Rosa chinensis TaxID=74649 RepID=A0A2P6RFR7_ROSCH|nr:putative P-loop containing nucleoside triphosphate hydrolase [Rosa chinensis]